MEKNNHYKAIILLALACLLVYLNIFSNKFVWDDYNLILKNEEIRQWNNIPKFFTTDIERVYRPVRTVFYALNYHLWQEEPFGYHLSALLTHIINSVLIYLIAYSILKKQGASLLAGLFFATHPIHTESITFITASFDEIGMIFLLLSLYLYIQSYDYGEIKKIPYSASIFFALLAFFTYEMTLILPLLIVLYDYSFRKLLSKRKLYIPYFAASFLYLFVRFFLVKVGARNPYHGGSLYRTLITMSKVFLYYIKLLLVPINLTMLPVVPLAKSPFEPVVFLSIVFLFVLLMFTLKMLKHSKITFFCISWFFITLLPVSNIIPIQTLMAERYLYLPSVGFSILLALAVYKIQDLKIRRLSREHLKIITVLCSIFILLLYSAGTITRNRDWKDNFTVWSKTAKASPDNWLARYNFGVLCAKKGLYNKAIVEFKETIKLKPDYSNAHFNLALAYSFKGLYNKAIAEYKEAIRFKPTDADAHHNLAVTYSFKGLYNEAEAEFKEAIRLKPDFLKAHENLARLYEEMGQEELARQEWEKVAEINTSQR